jgi:large subunit ribosomal protein L9
MKVLYLEDDRVEEVSVGFARNYLLPRKLVVAATTAVVAAAAKRQEKKKAEVEQKRAEMQALAEKLSAADLTISVDVGEGGKLFGSVTTADIAAAVKRAVEIDLDKRKIELLEPIRLIGEYSVAAKLFQDIRAKLKVKVAAR